jgi:ATP-dependent Zn protease
MSKTSTAYHEAGHATIARVLTLHAGSATIEPDYEAGRAGVAITYDPYSTLHQWEKRGKVRENEDAVWHARIMAYMAGAEAEMVLLGRTATGDSDDRYQILLMWEELRHLSWERFEPRLRAMTRMLVRRHRARIERVANALLAETTLSAERLDELVGRSINDVKVNAPLLLAYHAEKEK